MKDSSTATERVGRYQLLEPIGGGPNGMVSRAKVFGVAGFERQFAVKRFLPELTVGAIAQSLSAAARSYGSLEHPRIARMSEFGVAQGQTFTAVELVTGLDAFRLMQETKLAGTGIAAGGALALVSQAARAVGYAHGRGLSHLGLSPTNVIVTADGDVKVTDFGILAATMPPNPIESPRLAHRVPYLAPEQIAGEATSAATDVFVLGVIAYELVTGQRAYRGETAPQIAQAILAGPPAEPPLPRPIVRVLQRCLARSPFERFPDARALADALDAALRVAPVPGTRKDIGAQIKTTLDRYATLNEGNMSGMVALNLEQSRFTGSAFDPSSRPDAPTEQTPIIIASPASTQQDMPRPYTTMPGIAPPPIPVPPGVTPPPNSGLQSPGTNPPTHTVPGFSPAKKPVIPVIGPPAKKPNGPASQKTLIATPTPVPTTTPIPSIVSTTTPIPSIARTMTPPPPRPPTPPPLPPAQKPGALTMGWDAQPEPPSDDVIEEPSGLIDLDEPLPSTVKTVLMHGDPVPPEPDQDDGRMPADDPSTMQGVQPANAFQRSQSQPAQSFESTTGEMSRIEIDSLSRQARPTSEVNAVQAGEMTEPGAPAYDEDDSPEVDLHAPDITPLPPGREHRIQVAQPYPQHDYNAAVAAHQPQHQYQAPPPQQPAPQASARQAQSSSGVVKALVALVVLGGLGVGGWFAYQEFVVKKKQEPVVATNGSGSAKIDTTHVGSGSNIASAGSNAGSNVGSAGSKVGSGSQGSASAGSGGGSGSAVVAVVPPDAGTTPDKPPDVVKPTQTSDKLTITSKPAGARVFIDGADQGATPVKLPGTADRHTIAVLLPGHDLYIAEVDGKGVFDVTLKPITPVGGHAGIKVLKCKDKERYYVFVDGAPTGMTCPTERIDTSVGPHVVEVYDIVTETRRKFDINVKDERLSVRVKLDN